MLTPRPYQRASVDAIYDYFARASGNPLIVMPTGSGKSLVQALFQHEVLQKWPGQRILLLSHVKELLEQNAEKIRTLWPEAPLGIYSAGLRQRVHHMPMTVASIQSIHKRAALVGHIDLVIVDECHLIPADSQTMYRRFLSDLTAINPALKVIGMSATPYRLDSGYLHEGDDAIFTDIAFDLPITELIRDGYLCPLVTKAGVRKIDLEGVRTRGGEFVPADIEIAVHKDGVLEAAIDEIIAYGRERRSWLVFCNSVENAAEVADLFSQRGHPMAPLSGKTPRDERDRLIRQFRAGEIHLSNVNVLTTGFDAPGLDLIAMLRPTKSTSLFVQMLGRGMRTAPGKANCILEGTPVLTDCGLVPIDQVTTDMRVWDGVEYVSHQGAVYMGERDVITYAGLTATPDHRVWTEEGWATLGQCALACAAISVAGVGGDPVREADGVFRRGAPQHEIAPCGAYDDMYRLRSSRIEGLHQSHEGQGGLPNVCSRAEGARVANSKSECSSATLHESEEQSLRRLRRERDRVSIRLTACDGDLGTGESRLAPGDADRSDRQRSTLRAGESALLVSQPEPIEHEISQALCPPSPLSRVAPGGALRRQHVEGHVFSGHDRGGDHQALSATLVQAKGRVWDLLNVGPRHRFTAAGLIVSNCLVLDFAGNVERHGPVDDLRIHWTQRGNGAAKTDAPAGKECEHCRALVSIFARECPQCGQPFTFKPVGPKHGATASDAALLTSQIEPEWCSVDEVYYALHTKKDRPDSLRVEYISGIRVFTEWVCIEHARGSFAHQMAERWFQLRGAAVPSCCQEALGLIQDLPKTRRILVRREGKFDRITGYELESATIESAA